MAEITRHLQGQSPYFAFANTWLENRLAEQGLTTSQLILTEGQNQAADQVSIGNSINSLRFLSSNDWREFVESHSLVEEILQGDPVGTYAAMDFATRDRYRHVVENIAKRSRDPEHMIATKAIRLAKAAWLKNQLNLEDRQSHVGFYLIDDGRPALERAAAMKLSPEILVAKLGRRFPLFFYFASILALTIGVTGLYLNCLDDNWSVLALVLLAVPFLMCAVQLGIGVMLWLTTILVKPRQLPRLDFSAGIPPQHRTMVVVPTLLNSPDGVRDLLDNLEVRYLANRDENLHFALLTDLEDAAQEVMPADAALVGLARAGIEELIQKYTDQRSDIFYLFHRPRRWNAKEGVWMGYERKRGKLMQFNALLRGVRESFAEIVGDTSVLADIRYVITLDTDTQLPREAAHQLVGSIAHILNRPVVDPRRHRVTAGYGVLQPRVGVSLPSSRRSWFVRLFAGDPGLDPYTRVVSDVYQDLFSEGSFIGKGIYDVQAFEQCCGGLPENTILSHDLLEGAYVRSGLLSDVVLFEEFPARYAADVSRRHRWMRGDWQILWWLLPWIPAQTEEGKGIVWAKNAVSALSWWKIFDNLRRSLVPVAMLTLLLGSWLTGDASVGIASSVFFLIVGGMVPLLTTVGEVFSKPTDLPMSMHLRAALSGVGKQLSQYLLLLVFLPYDAFISLDAIVRTLARMFWTKTKLLEWKTSSDANRSARSDLLGAIQSMWIGPAVALLAILLGIFQPANLIFAGPFAALWFFSPLAAWWLSLPQEDIQERLTDEQRIFLRRISRLTWRFFEVFVTEQENWLPPDNIQEHPKRAIASRTSPTNIGMALLANLAAFDFGYCSAGQLLERTRNTLATMARMDKYKGHLYNWYDTRSLKPLPPLYVSTVDSGNLAAYLLVLRTGLLGLPTTPILSPQAFSGLRDTLLVVLDVARKPRRTDDKEAGAAPSVDSLRRLDELETDLKNTPQNLASTAGFLTKLSKSAALIIPEGADDSEWRWWCKAFGRACTDLRDDFLQFAGWATLSPPAEEIWQFGTDEPKKRLAELRAKLAGLDAGPTLAEVAALGDSLCPLLDAILRDLAELPAKSGAGAVAWLGQLRQELAASAQRATARIKDASDLAPMHGFRRHGFHLSLQQNQ